MHVDISSLRASASLAVVALALVGAGCVQTPTVEAGRCASNADCPEYSICDPAGVCRCNDDQACDPTEFCNLAGSCQVKLECLTNEDCTTAGSAASRCDTRAARESFDTSADDAVFSKSGGQCVTLSAQRQCLIDSHCPFGTYCANDVCLPGCRDNGDCALGDPCINGQCDPTPGACNENSYCAYGERCVGNACQPHRQAGELCQSCDSRVCFSNNDCPVGVPCVGGSLLAAGTCNACGNPDTFCLIDPSIPATPCTSDNQCAQGTCKKRQCLQDTDCDVGTCQGASLGGLFTPPTFGFCSSGACGAEFCGTDACNDTADPCPRGYSCGEIAVVVKPCTRGGGQCDGQEACSADLGGENNNAGYCTCDSDADCPGGGTCVNPGRAGRCVIGNSCAPVDGLLCGDVR